MCGNGSMGFPAHQANDIVRRALERRQGGNSGGGGNAPRGQASRGGVASGGAAYEFAMQLVDSVVDVDAQDAAGTSTEAPPQRERGATATNTNRTKRNNNISRPSSSTALQEATQGHVGPGTGQLLTLRGVQTSSTGTTTMSSDATPNQTPVVECTCALRPAAWSKARINARGETVLQADWIIHRQARCLVILDGFFEVNTVAAERVHRGQTHFFYKKKEGVLNEGTSGDGGSSNREPLFIAGVLTPTKRPQPGSRDSHKAESYTFSDCVTIVTVAAGPDMNWCHNRQPLILESPEAIHSWLHASSHRELYPLIAPSEELSTATTTSALLNGSSDTTAQQVQLQATVPVNALQGYLTHHLVDAARLASMSGRTEADMVLPGQSSSGGTIESLLAKKQQPRARASGRAKLGGHSSSVTAVVVEDDDSTTTAARNTTTATVVDDGNVPQASPILLQDILADEENSRNPTNDISGGGGGGASSGFGFHSALELSRLQPVAAGHTPTVTAGSPLLPRGRARTGPHPDPTQALPQDGNVGRLLQGGGGNHPRRPAAASGAKRKRSSSVTEVVDLDRDDLHVVNGPVLIGGSDSHSVVYDLCEDEDEVEELL